MSKLSLFIEIANIFLKIKFDDLNDSIDVSTSIDSKTYYMKCVQSMDAYFIHRLGDFTIFYDNYILISNGLGEILVNKKINRHEYKITNDEAQFILENGRVDLSDIDESYLEQILNDIKQVIENINNIVVE